MTLTRWNAATQALLLLVSSTQVFAQEPPPSGGCPQARCGEPHKHELGEHSFLPFYLVSRSFADSTAVLATGVASRTLANGGQELKLASLTPTMAVQVNVWKGLALSLGLTGLVVAGIDQVSVVQYGASTGYSWSFGALYEVVRAKSDVLSVALVVSRPHIFSASPANAVIAAINDLTNQSDPEAVASDVNTQWKPTLRWAHAFSPAFGVQATLGGRFNSVEGDPSDSGNKGTFGVGFDMDLGKLTSVPIGFGLSYARNQLLSAPGNNADTVVLGIFETFSRSFNAGVELGRNWAGGDSFTVAAFSIRAYFN